MSSRVAVVMIIAVCATAGLVGLLLTVLASWRERSKIEECKEHLRIISFFIAKYPGGIGGRSFFPPLHETGAAFMQMLWDYWSKEDEARPFFRCPVTGHDVGSIDYRGPARDIYNRANYPQGWMVIVADKKTNHGLSSTAPINVCSLSGVVFSVRPGEPGWADYEEGTTER